MGRSATFTLCRDMSEFPSITIEGGEDHALLDSLREQSPISLHSGRCSISSSFVLVEDEQWSWAGEDPPTTPPATREGPQTTPPPREGRTTTPPIDEEGHMTTPPIDGEDPPTTPPTDPQTTPPQAGEGPQTTPPPAREGRTTTPPIDGEGHTTTPPATREGRTTTPPATGPALERVALEPTATGLEPSPHEHYLNHGGDDTGEQHSHNSRETLPESNGVSETPQPSDETLANKSPDDGVAVEASPSGVREGPPSLSFLQEASLTSSTLVVHSLSQSEAWRIKNNNKELWAKVQKLSAGLEAMQRQRQELEGRLAREEGEKQVLQESLAELGQQEADLRGKLRTAEEEKQELSRENNSLQARTNCPIVQGR